MGEMCVRRILPFLFEKGALVLQLSVLLRKLDNLLMVIEKNALKFDFWCLLHANTPEESR